MIRREIEGDVSRNHFYTQLGRSCHAFLNRKRLLESTRNEASGDRLLRLREELYAAHREALDSSGDCQTPRYLVAVGMAVGSPTVCYVGVRKKLTREAGGNFPNDALVLTSSVRISPAARAKIERDIIQALPGLVAGSERVISERLINPIGIGTVLLDERAMALVRTSQSNFDFELLWIGFESITSREHRNSSYLASCADVFADEVRLGGLLKQAREETRAAIERIERAKLAVARVAHDIRSPLGSLEGVVGLLTEGEKEREYFDLAEIGRESCRYVRQLTDDLIAAARDGTDIDVSGPLQCDVVQTAGLIVQSFRTSGSPPNISCVVEAEGINPTLHAKVSPTIFRRILENILSNAIKYGGGTTITVRIGTSNLGVTLSINDLGQGISKEEMEELFRPFARKFKHETGYGLGLCSVKSLVDSLGGRLDVNSQLGFGTTVIVTLPFSRSNNQLENASIDDDGPMVLILDDSAELGDSLKRLLRQRGVSSKSFIESNSVLDSLSRYPGSSILTDYRLDSESALSVIQKVRSVDPLVRVAVMSGQLPEEAAYALAAKGVEEVFSKPVDIQRLVEWVKLGSVQAAGEGSVLTSL